MKIISTKSDYNSALKCIEELIAANPQPGTSDFEELNALGDSVSAYEEIYFPIEEP